MGFREADRIYEVLLRRREAGELSEDEFDEERRRLSVRDEKGRWWAKSARTGEWHVYDGEKWVPGVPPGYEHEDDPEDPPGPPPRSGDSPSSPAPGPSNGAGRRRGGGPRVLRSLGMAAVVLFGVGLVVAAVVGWFGLGEAYALVEHESGGLSVEVPSDWDETIMVDSEGEKGRDSWSSWLGEEVGPSLTVVNGLDSWRTGAEGHQGVYIVSSKELVSYEDEYLVEAGPNDYWETCEGGGIQDFNRGGYSGKILQWSECGGESGHVAVTLAAAPEGRECVVVMQIGGYFRTDADEEKIRRILDTFETDCGAA